MPKSTTPKATRKTTKARKSAKNQPVTFRETAAALPLTTTNPAPRLSQSQMRATLIATWAVVMVLIGTAIGLRLLANQTLAVQYPPVPVAKANVKVASSVASGITVIPSVANTSQSLSVVPATALSQAQGGSPYSVLSEVTYQPATATDALTPGYSNDGREQGNLGTAPVE